jgi:membrane-associated phospholipid phosphatase
VNIIPVTGAASATPPVNPAHPVDHRHPQVRRVLTAFSAAVVIAAVAVAIGSQLPDATGADDQISQWFATHRSPGWNSITGFFSEMASTMVVIGIALVVVIVELVRRHRDGVWLIIVAMTGEVTMFLAITALVDRPRPTVEHLDSAPPTSSFPSGHTFATFVLWTTIAVIATVHMWPLVLRVLTRVLAVVMPAAVALSRVYRGMHHPTDVTASIILGVVWMVVVVFLFAPTRDWGTPALAQRQNVNENWSN